MVPAVILTPFWGWTSRRPKPTFIRWSKALHLLTLAETQNSMKSRNLVCEVHFGVPKDKIWPGGQSGLILMGGGRDCGGEHGATAAMGGSGRARARPRLRPETIRRPEDRRPAVESSGEPRSRFWCRWAPRTGASWADQQGNEHMDHALSSTTMKTEKCLFTESEKAKTFRMARFLSQKLSGLNLWITSFFKFATNTRKKCGCKFQA